MFRGQSPRYVGLSELSTFNVKIDKAACAGHHFCRVSVDIGRYKIQEEPHQRTFIQEEVAGEGVAKKSSIDHNDEYVGETLALSRAMVHLAAKLDTRAWGKVKHNDDMKERHARVRTRREIKKHYDALNRGPRLIADIAKALSIKFGRV